MLDTPDNRNRAVALIEQLISRDDTMLFVGAGVSIAAGYPGWIELMDKMQARLQQVLDSPKGVSKEIRPKGPIQIQYVDDLLWRAQEYKQVLGKDIFNEVLADAFRDDLYQGQPAVAKTLIRLPLAHILTTNFETSLERAFEDDGRELDTFDWTNKPKVRDFITRDRSEPNATCFIYLHGCIHSNATPAVPDNLVLCDSDYAERYLLNASTVHKMLAIFMTRPVLFVGFSFTDPAVQTVFQALTAHLGGTDSAVSSHFILSPAAKADSCGTNWDEQAHSSWLSGKFGVQPIYYLPGEKHADLTTTLDKIATVIERCRRHQTVREDVKRRVLIHNELARLLLEQPGPKMTEPEPPQVMKTRPKQVSGTIPKTPPPDDPNKWQFGEQSTRDGYILTGEVTVIERGWFGIRLEVTASEGKLLDHATFFLHPSFEKPRRREGSRDGCIKLELEAFGAFTVGVLINAPPKDNPRTSSAVKLELDLAELETAPPLFRAR
jgi:hypothetical protein